MMDKYLVVDSKPDYTYVTEYDSEKKMLDSVKDDDMDDLTVYIVTEKIKLKKIVQIVVDSSESP